MWRKRRENIAAQSFQKKVLKCLFKIVYSIYSSLGMMYRGRNTVEECCATGGTVEVSQGECKSGRGAGQVLGKLLQNGEYWPSGDHEKGTPCMLCCGWR